jgi:PAS domain-containing protein
MVINRNQCGRRPPRSRRAGRPVGHASLACAEPVWREIVDALPAPIAVTNADGCIVAANAAFRSALEPRGEGEPFYVDGADVVLILGGVRFVCHRLDDVGHVALIGRT